MTRHCGPCTLCCTALRVVELDKPAGERCRHLGPRGCRIYDERPASCRAFECLWLQRDAIPSNLRPDKSGAVFSANSSGNQVVLHLDPRRPRAHAKGKLARYLEALSFKKLPIFVGEKLTIHRRNP